MGKSFINEKENTSKTMKNFIKKYFKEILLVLTIGVVIFLSVKIFTPAPDKSELLKYKLQQLDNKINGLKQQQKQLDDSISMYKKDIERIDENLENIRSQKTVINNYYEEKDKEIKGWSNKQIDSSLRKRYKF
jgi:septal ring factor EnvC (AmiA/AmiB activator)